jgi:endogenous inhibitor of DNA gyrase (YacG/DUF329 family)
MDPPEGYVALPCLVCGRTYQTLRDALAPFCSIACADAADRPAAPLPERPRLLRAVRCSYCQAPMQVAPRVRPPFQCARCAGWRR